MTEPTTTELDEPRPPVPLLAPERLTEIRALLAELTPAVRRMGTAAADTGEVLTRCRTALEDLLADRDDLVRANGEAGEELARWRGDIW